MRNGPSWVFGSSAQCRFFISKGPGNTLTSDADHLASMSASLLKEPSPRFTRYLKKCLVDFETSPERDTDELLVQLVEIQRLTERIHNWTSRDEDEAEIPGLPRAPMAAYQEAFAAEIQKRRNSLPENLKNNSESAYLARPSPLHH